MEKILNLKTTEKVNKARYTTQIDNTISAIEDQNLSHDSRYIQLNLLKNRLKGKFKLKNG